MFTPIGSLSSNFSVRKNQEVGNGVGSLCLDQPRTTQSGKTRHQREIDATDRQLDQLVYELYGLTEDEIKIAGIDNRSKSKPFC